MKDYIACFHERGCISPNWKCPSILSYSTVSYQLCCQTFSLGDWIGGGVTGKELIGKQALVTPSKQGATISLHMDCTEKMCKCPLLSKNVVGHVVPTFRINTHVFKFIFPGMAYVSVHTPKKFSCPVSEVVSVMAA